MVVNHPSSPITARNAAGLIHYVVGGRTYDLRTPAVRMIRDGLRIQPTNTNVPLVGFEGKSAYDLYKLMYEIIELDDTFKTCILHSLHQELIDSLISPVIVYNAEYIPALEFAGRAGGISLSITGNRRKVKAYTDKMEDVLFSNIKSNEELYSEVKEYVYGKAGN